MGGACSMNGEEESLQVIGGNSIGKETTTKTKMWVNNINMG
jgi:hypothetical protein